MTKAATKARIEVFRTGTFTPMEGAAITYSAADLKAVADVYDASTAPAPIVVGHPKTDAPAYGWVESFDYDPSADRLYANVGEIDPAFSEAVKAGRYKKVSMSFFRPADAANPVPGTWYPRHVGFLGGAAPAVTGLTNVQFTASDAPVITVDFGEPGFEQTAGILRTLRDFLIEKFGLEDADKALPGYRIEWLGETEVEKPAALRPAFSQPKEKEPALPQPDPTFAAREADVSAREKRLADRERKLAHDDNVSFAESLVTEGKILPVSKDKLVSLLDALPSDASVSFAAGEASVSVAQGLRDLLAAQPKAVSFGKIDMPENSPDRGAVSFSSDGKAVDPEQLGIHQKALEYQIANPGTEYLAAVRAVS